MAAVPVAAVDSEVEALAAGSAAAIAREAGLTAAVDTAGVEALGGVMVLPAEASVVRVADSLREATMAAHTLAVVLAQHAVAPTGAADLVDAQPGRSIPGLVMQVVVPASPTAAGMDLAAARPLRAVRRRVDSAPAPDRDAALVQTQAPVPRR